MVKARESTDDRSVKDLNATYGLLVNRGDVSQIGVVGLCWGGRVAWLGACHLPKLDALAMCYGGRIKLAMGEGNPPAITLVSDITCPVIGFFGNDDQNPSPEDVDD